MNHEQRITNGNNNKVKKEGDMDNRLLGFPGLLSLPAIPLWASLPLNRPLSAPTLSYPCTVLSETLV